MVHYLNASSTDRFALPDLPPCALLRGRSVPPPLQPCLYANDYSLAITSFMGNHNRHVRASNSEQISSTKTIALK